MGAQNRTATVVDRADNKTVINDDGNNWSSLLHVYDDEPKKKKNDDPATIAIDLSAEKISPSCDDDNNNDDDGDNAVAITNEKANSRSPTIDLVDHKAGMNGDCINF